MSGIKYCITNNIPKICRRAIHDKLKAPPKHGWKVNPLTYNQLEGTGRDAVTGFNPLLQDHLIAGSRYKNFWWGIHWTFNKQFHNWHQGGDFHSGMLAIILS